MYGRACARSQEPELLHLHSPRPGIHNSGWLQSPGLAIVNAGRSAWDRLEIYVKELLTRFADDDRILMWDLYNEPGNNGNNEQSTPLLEAVFSWARSVETSQPITVAVWRPEDSINEFVLASSDVTSFHHYEPPENLRQTIAGLRAYERPLVCSEWMARTRGSLVETNLPVFRDERVGCITWGLVDGKTQTKYVWEDPRPDSEPDPWFHELFHTDLSPYREDEIALFRRLTGRGTDAG